MPSFANILMLYLGVFYAVALVIYFAAVNFRGYQTHQVETQVAAIANDYTNAVQLKAQYAVLKERADLTYAALDCWQTVAQQLPQGILLALFSFADGQKLTLSGSAPQDQVNTLFDFDSSLRKAQLNGQPMFNSEGGEQLRYNQSGDKVTWSFSLLLKQSEEAAP